MYAQLVCVPSLRWHHKGHDGVSNHQPHHCLLTRLFGCRSKETSKLHITGLCVGNSSGTGELPAQMASNAEHVSIWWRHHDSEWECVPYVLLCRTRNISYGVYCACDMIIFGGVRSVLLKGIRWHHGALSTSVWVTACCLIDIQPSLKNSYVCSNHWQRDYSGTCIKRPGKTYWNKRKSPFTWHSPYKIMLIFPVAKDHLSWGTTNLVVVLHRFHYNCNSNKILVNVTQLVAENPIDDSVFHFGESRHLTSARMCWHQHF